MADVGIGFVDILPRTDQFTKVLSAQMQKSLGGASKAISDTLGKLSTGTVAAIGAGAVAIGAITKAITDGVKATTEWAGEVRSLQRVTGQTAESASALAAAGNTLGISTQQMTIGFGLLAKNIVNASANLTKYGIATQDAQGNVLPFDTVLSNVIDKFQTLPAGPEQAAFAMNVFGRSGKALIPILQRGQEGLAQLEDAARSAGLVLSQNDVDAAKALTIAQRQLGEAFKGASIQIGRLFIPLITPLVEGFTKMVDGAIQLGTAIGHTLAPFLTQVGDAFSRLMDAAQPLQPLFEELGKVIGSGLLAFALVPLILALKALVLAFDLLTGAVNLLIDGINLLISGLNLVIDASNSLLHTHFQHINALQGVTTATGETTAATTDYTSSLDTATTKTTQLAKAQSGLRGAVKSAGDGLLSLTTTVKDTFNISQKEMAKGFQNMLASAQRFREDLRILNNLPVGLSAKNMADFQNFLISQGPGYVDRFVKLSADRQRQFVADWQHSFDAIQAGKDRLASPVNFNVNTNQAEATVNRFIAATEAKRLTITADVRFNAQNAPHGASGGYVTRNGIRRLAAGGDVDTIPAMLAPGEFVFRRSAVDRIGLPELQRMNQGGGAAVGPAWTRPQQLDGALRIMDWRNGLTALDGELAWEDTVRTR